MSAASFCKHRLSIITGHYGTGKTEFSVNLALALASDGEQVMVADLDVVNPYFRSRERRTMLDADGQPAHVCYARPVTIGDDCWLGANVVVCSGVTIGSGCVIGAGSVVTKDIPANSFAAGVPCRVIRPITQEDSMRFKPEIADGYVPAE